MTPVTSGSDGVSYRTVVERGAPANRVSCWTARSPTDPQRECGLVVNLSSNARTRGQYSRGIRPVQALSFKAQPYTAELFPHAPEHDLAFLIRHRRGTDRLLAALRQPGPGGHRG